MDDQPIESRMHYVFRMRSSVLALDAVIFSLAALACLVLPLGLTVYNFSTDLFILGLLIMIFGMYTGQPIGQGGFGPRSYTRSFELKVPRKYRPSAFSNITLAIAGLIAIIAGVVLPLVF